MRAVVLDKVGGVLRVAERAPVVREGWERIDVTACGVCHSDLHVVEGLYPSPLPLVLGHEVTGVHPELGPVMVYAPWGCSKCRMCTSGQEMLCPDGREAGLVEDGGYAEQMVVPSKKYLHPLGSLDPITSAPLACGGLTAFRAVGHTLDALRAAGSQATVTVIGAGGLGQFAIQYLRLLTDAAVYVIDASPSKQSRALDLGAHDAAGPGAFIAQSHAVLDFVGAQSTLELAAAMVHRQGIVVVVGLYGGRIPFGLGTVPHEARFMSSIWGSNSELAQLLALAQRETIHHTVEAMPLSRAAVAHERLRSGDALGRIVLVPSLDR
jgi:alcohol dehydrogenase, propanol-preferring